jgi:Holliday junction resolvase RusA-like endonuclease
MAIDKALGQAPMGLDLSEMSDEPAIEIEIEDPEAVRIGIDGQPILEIEKEEIDDDFNANLAEEMDEGELTELCGDLIGEFEEDTSSRKDWMQTYVDGLELLGMKIEDRTEPWPGACGVYHPLLSEALVKFQAETIMETFPSAGPVKTQIIGKETAEKKEAAIRVKDDMNYQLTEVMVEYRPEHERMLWGLGLAGNAFKKVYFDPSLDRQVSLFVPAEDVVVPYGASNIQTAERVTHVMRKTENELRKLQFAGFYRDVELGDPVDSFDEVEKKIAEKMGFRATSDDRYKILEMHVDMDLPGYEDKDEDGEPTGIALPYVVTIEKGTQTVLAIRRNWNPDDELKQKRNHFVHYSYIPGFGFYAFGLIHLIGAFAKSGTSIIRQLVDAGTLSNLPGGFKTKGLRVKGDDTPIAPAEFRDVDVASGTIKDNIMTLPYKEPSQVLYTLLGTIVEEGRRFASAADLKVSDMSAQSPVGTTLAILERTLKVMSAVQARIHYSMKQEFKLLRDIIRDYTPEDYSYEPEEGSRRAKQSDYDDVEVIPVSDPNAATMSQKVVQYQAVMQLAQQAPQLYDLPYLHRQMLEVLGIKNASKLVPMQDDQKPRDPVSENMDVIKSKPLKAFAYQDHEAHITTHQSFMQDPMTAQMIGQNPMAQQMMAALQSHIAEHFGYMYRNQIEQQVGAPIPTFDDDKQIPQDIEFALSRLVAQASQQLLQKNQAEAAQQQAQQQAQDPIIQMQMQELQLKGQDLQRKATKDQTDAQLKAAQLELEKQRISSQERQAQAQIAAKNELEGTRIGIEIAKEERLQANRNELEEAKLGVQIAQIMRPQSPKKESK